MSSKGEETRLAILESARRLVTDPARRPIAMADIAAEAGVSRQAVYLHFETRTQLLIALVRHVDLVHGFAALLHRCRQAGDARRTLSAFIGAWAGYVALITDVARAMRAAAAADGDAALAWRDRMTGFTGVCADFVAQLQDDGALADDWSAADAADFLATMLSIGNWQELVEERGWSQLRYARAMRRSVEQSLLRAPTAKPMTKTRMTKTQMPTTQQTRRRRS